MKRVFLAAILATVAIGAANANTYYQQGANTPIDCEIGVATCADQVTGDGLYRKAADAPGGQGTKVPVSEYQDLQFN
jgi:hypothetical protein